MNAKQIIDEAEGQLWLGGAEPDALHAHNREVIAAAIEKATDPFRVKINCLVSELDTIWHEGRAYEQKFGVKPVHASSRENHQ